MGILVRLIGGRLVGLLPFLLPMVTKNKNLILVGFLAVFGMPILKRLFKTTPKTEEHNVNIESIAEVQYGAMHYAGTKEERLYSSIENLTAKDLKRLFEVFGERKYGFVGGAWWGVKKNLFEWYYSELDNEEIERMRLIWLKSGLWVD